MSNKQALAPLVDRLKPLWLLLTGGAFVSFAGSALTLVYFWRIGGVPVGQAVNTGAMAKIVLSSAFFLAAVFLMAWIAPTLLSQVVADGSPFAMRLRRLFTRPSVTSSVLSQQMPERMQPPVPISPGMQVVLAADHMHGPALIASAGVETVSGARVFAFAASTVGSGCLGLTLFALGVGRDKNLDGPWLSLLYCLVIPALIAGVLMTYLWRRFNRLAGSANHGAKFGSGGSMDWVAWGFFGYGSAVVALFPLLSLLLVFIKTDFLLEQDSYAAFCVGALSISIGIVAAYSVSLGALLQRRQGDPVRLGVLLGFNALILLAVVMALGISSRILEAVMVMSSVRVENAIMMLKPEGCELLKSMQAQGWGRARGASEEDACILYDVTIQSTLEPAMQLACWRGIVAEKRNGTAVNEKAAIAAAPPASEASGAVGVTARTSQVPASSVEPTLVVEILGRQGAFTIPTELIRSVWKTGGIRLPNQQPVCPKTLTVDVGLAQASRPAQAPNPAE